MSSLFTISIRSGCTPTCIYNVTWNVIDVVPLNVFIKMHLHSHPSTSDIELWQLSSSQLIADAVFFCKCSCARYWLAHIEAFTGLCALLCQPMQCNFLSESNKMYLHSSFFYGWRILNWGFWDQCRMRECPQFVSMSININSLQFFNSVTRHRFHIVHCTLYCLANKPLLFGRHKHVVDIWYAVIHWISDSWKHELFASL